MKITFLYTAVLFFVSGLCLAQERMISGQVTDRDDGAPVPGVSITMKGTASGTTTDADGRYSIKVPSSQTVLVFSFIGYVTQEIPVGTHNAVNVQLVRDATSLSEVVISGHRTSRQRKEVSGSVAQALSGRVSGAEVRSYAPYPVNTEDYAVVEESVFQGADKKPLSTFSIDVDAASYSNLRRFINNGEVPPRDAIRIEEMVNYFDYDYDEPKNDDPFKVHMEISGAPWNENHHLVHIGLQGKRIPVEDLPPSNLVFLIDVSGSMNHPNKLPLVKKSFQILLDQLRAEDHVAIVVYAGAAGVVLEPTSGSEKVKIQTAIENLHAGGSTAGGAGLRLAYAQARQHFNAKGNNRIILATDGDFNVGESSNAAMEDLVEDKREEGVYLTVLGFGMGNLKDSKMELLADKGNGNYAYIDNINEARKVFVNEFAGTLFTIATDVKLQVEFNPAKVQAYRLVGYENRKMNDEDFNNDRKDAGDLGSGHTVTALYEIIPAGVKSSFYSIDKLKYQPSATDQPISNFNDWLTVKLRYKKPGHNNSHLLEEVMNSKPHQLKEASDDFRWSASVAAFGMLLVNSPYLGDYQPAQILTLAREARGSDEQGYRSEFINLIKSYAVMTPSASPTSGQ